MGTGGKAGACHQECNKEWFSQAFGPDRRVGHHSVRTPADVNTRGTRKDRPGATLKFPGRVARYGRSHGFQSVTPEVTS